MKITENTPERLIIDHVPWGLGLSMIGLIVGSLAWGFYELSTGRWVGLFVIFVGVTLGGVLLILMVERTQVVLDRRQGQVLHRRRSILGYQETSHNLSAISGAETREHRYRREKPGFRTVLVFSDGETDDIPLTATAAVSKEPERITALLNEWLNARGDVDLDDNSP